MKKDDLFFQEDPPASLDAQVQKAVAPLLSQNREMSRPGAWLSRWPVWGSLGATAIAGFFAVWLTQRSRTKNSEDFWALSVLADGAAIDEDLDLLAQDIDFLEHLDLLESLDEEDV
jgi:hypothetical protein